MSEATVQVPEGYKMTEVGVIPEDWEVSSLDFLSNIKRGASPRPIESPLWFDENSDVGWLRISDVTSASKYLTKTTQKLSKSGISKSKYVNKGNLIMSICATVGRPILNEVDICIHDGFVVYENLKSNKEYLYYLLSFIEKNWTQHGQTGSQMNLNTIIVGETLIALPQKKEQHAIAQALSDVDSLIQSQEKLLHKKRDIKQATMQQLLTGRMRLPGFSGEWECINIAHSSILKARIGWQGLTTAEYLVSGSHALVTGTDFKDGKIEWSYCSFVSKERYDQDRNIQLNLQDVLLTKDGTIGKVAFVSNLPYTATLNSGVFVIRPKNGAYIPKYLFFVLSSQIFVDFLNKLQAGSTI